MAQDNLWVNGGQVLDFNDATNGLQVCSLPPGNDYNGAPAQYAQNAQYDENGKLLFFVVDGNIYDNAGYLMADNDADPNCVDCLMKGIQLLSIVPVPGTCDKYYIITADVNFASGLSYPYKSQLAYAVLDLSKDSHFHTGRKGRVWNQQDMDAAGWSPTGAGMNNRQVGAQTLYFIAYGSASPVGDGWIWSLNTSNILHTVIDGVAGSSAALMIKNCLNYLEAPITGQGIGPVTVLEDVYTPDADNSLTMAGQLTAAVGPDGVIRVASTTNSSTSTSTALDDYTLQCFSLNLTGTPTGTPITQINTNGNHLDATNFRTRGATFSPNGRYLYFAQPFVPYVGYVDVLDPTYAVHDLGAQLGIDLSAYGQGQINSNIAPAGTGTALYLPSASGMGCVLNVDNPASASFQTVTSTGMSVGTPPTSAWTATQQPTGGNWVQYLMDQQNWNDQQVPHLELAVCCQDNERIPEWSHELFFGGSNTYSDPWTPEDNPLTGPLTCPPNTTLPQSVLDVLYGHAYFEEDFVVQNGARLYVRDMDWHFAPNARLIIERGAYVRFDNCTLQGSLNADCQPQRWPGIRIEGTTIASQFPLMGGNQGYVSMVNTTVANAVTGVWCAKAYGVTKNSAYFGGVIRAFDCTFKNCITGVRITDYNHNNAPEASTFYNTTFVTDNDRPDQTAPYAQAYIANVRTVNFANCRFTNQSGDPVLMNGTGVMIHNGQVNVSGSDYQTAYFENLMVGVNNSGGTLSPSTINHMEFRNNQYGIFDMASHFSRYINNRIVVPGQGGTMYAATGMYLWQPQGYTIERNTFIGDGNSHNVGIYFLGINPALPYEDWVFTNTRIYDNTFNALYAGCIVKSAHRGHTQSQADQGLSLLCGDFTDNIYDIALLAASIIKPDQGHTGSQLSGNRFLTTANCTNTWDWNLDPEWNHIPQFNGMHLNVFRNEDPVCDVQCDYWPDFADIPAPGSGPWTAAVTCGDGRLDQNHTIPGDLAHYQLATSQLVSALNAYNGNLDAGEKPDLIDLLIKQEPPLSSSTVRDALLANSPLSDDVLITMLKREPALDPWHLTQVLVANVKLNPGVIETAKELLSPFYFGVVQDAQDGSGITWKQLMEQEIELRRREKADALASLGYLYGTDTITEGAVDSLRMIMASDSDLSYTQTRTAMYINDQNWSAAEAELSGPAEKLNGWHTYIDLLNYGAHHDGDWSQLEAGEVDILDQHAREGGAGAALANGILLCNGFTNYLPEVQFPRKGSEKRLVQVNATTPVARPALALYPNPASTEAYLKWPIEQKGGLIQVMDTQGRILLEHKAVENGLSRLDLSELPAGLYKVHLEGTELSAAFSIAR